MYGAAAQSPISEPSNPLSTGHAGTLGYIACDLDPHALAQRLERQGYRGAICGPSGCGKTITLQAVGSELLTHGLTPLPLLMQPDQRGTFPKDWKRAIRNARHTDALLLDGFDLLPLWARLWVWFTTMNAGAVVVTAKHTAAYTILARPKASIDLLEQLIARMLTVSDLDLDGQAILEQSDGNLRQALDIVNQRIQG